MTPHLTFFCELDPQPLLDLFATPGLIEHLQQLHAAISLGMLDDSPERGEVVQRLNRAGIPVTAWLLLPKEQGYWFNLDNARQAADRYYAFRAWSRRNGLQFAGVGLDIEPDIRALQELASRKLSGSRQFLQKARNRTRADHAEEIYRGLVETIRTDGWRVESYQFPFIVDERECGSRLVRWLTGVMDLPVDREVLMLYSSFYPNIGGGILYSYGRNAAGIGLGSTGGGVTIEGLADPRPLDWPTFQRDLMLASKMSDALYVFSLEGCVRQGFLEQLPGLNWYAPIEPPRGEIRKVETVRKLARGVLRASKWFV